MRFIPINYNYLKQLKTVKMKTIKEGDPQPLDCPECEEKMGYKSSAYLRTHYTTFYTSEGIHDGGQYSDYQPLIRQLKTLYCLECNSILPFKLD